MKEIASECCGSCEYCLMCNEQVICKKLSTNFCVTNVAPCDRGKCKGEVYRPRNPIKNYEDELLKLAIKKVLSCKSINPAYKLSMWEEIDLIEKVKNKKWENIKNEISK